MRIVGIGGSERVADLLDQGIEKGDRLDLLSPALSLFAFDALLKPLDRLAEARLVIPGGISHTYLLGTVADRSARNQLRARWLANRFRDWIEDTASVRAAEAVVPQGAMVVRGDQPKQALDGGVGLTSEGLGLAPGNRLALTRLAESPDEVDALAVWFDQVWDNLPPSDEAEKSLLSALDIIGKDRDPASIYAAVLDAIFSRQGEGLDEEEVVRSATGIRETKVWQKLYKFQRDGVVGAIDKLNRFGGCIIADSVGLGKTFEALSVIKYHELRNYRVLVLAPKRLRDNWQLYRANDRRNPLADDRVNYDILNHTDLSRDKGSSGEIDLEHVSWGNYDLVVIDESHNFRNKKTPRAGIETRYDRLMRRIVQEGVRTRVLMLSATPVNNRLADLRNQIAFATEGVDH
ncbi:MAG: DEAD/DEAH box helicase family protein, partial [Actinomycetota bacterium]